MWKRTRQTNVQFFPFVFIITSLLLKWHFFRKIFCKITRWILAEWLYVLKIPTNLFFFRQKESNGKKKERNFTIYFRQISGLSCQWRPKENTDKICTVTEQVQSPCLRRRCKNVPAELLSKVVLREIYLNKGYGSVGIVYATDTRLFLYQKSLGTNFGVHSMQRIEKTLERKTWIIFRN